MPTSLVHADSLLAVDVGAVTTRAVLFEVVDGRYRFIASGSAPSTAAAPYRNISEGVRRALDELRTITGREFVGADEQLIMPTKPDGRGVDTFAATLSAGVPLKIVAVGLLEDVSLESARRLASTIYGQVEQVISLNDRRRPEARIDLLLKLRPDLIIVAGGTENGASQSVLKLLEAVGLSCYLLPKEQRPDVLFAGNQSLKEEVQQSLEGLAELHFAPNIRPDLEVEQLEAAQSQIAQIYGRLRARDIPGVEELNLWSRGGLVPSAAGLGRVVRFLSKAHPGNKGVLGVDVGASATTVAAAFSGQLSLGIYPQLGLGRSLAKLPEQVSLAELLRWIPVEITESRLREYLANKALFPSTIPATSEELLIEQAVARLAMQTALKLAINTQSRRVVSLGENLLPLVEPILATGSVLTNAPNLAQTALMILDGCQPVGATTLVLDQNQIASTLGAAAAVNSLLAVQILDSNAFLHLGTVISPLSNVRPGTPVLRVKITYESGQETNLDVKQGALETLPLPYGQAARLQLQPLHRADIGMGAPGRGGGLRITGGALGVIIDARGRPIRMPVESDRRSELMKKWLQALGGNS